jgi:membrane fusion protein, multidrug efflux system
MAERTDMGRPDGMGAPGASLPGMEFESGTEPRIALWRRPRARLAVFVILIAVIGAGIAIWRYYAVRESTDDAQIDGRITPIAPRVGGTVLAVPVNDNQEVQAGTVLVRIDPRDYQVALQRAQADLADADAALQGARSGVPITATTTASQMTTAGANVQRAQAGASGAANEVDAARARLSSMQARLREANANSQKAGRDLERMKQLVAKDEISQQQYDATAAAAEAAKASVDAAAAAVAEAERGVAVAQSRQDQARNALEQAQAELRTARTAPDQVIITRARASSAEARVGMATAALEQAKLNLAYTTLTAPVHGVVSKKSVEVGQTVQPGQPLMAVVPLDDIWVTANFKETELRDMHVGQLVYVKVDAYGRTYRGRVQSISAATGARFSLLPPENATGNYVKVVQRVPVKIVFETGQDPEHLLRPGMSVDATVMVR